MSSKEGELKRLSTKKGIFGRDNKKWLDCTVTVSPGKLVCPAPEALDIALSSKTTKLSVRPEKHARTGRLFHTVSAQRFALTIGEVDEVFAATTEEEMYAWVEAIEKAGGLKREPEVKKETFIQKVKKRTSLTGMLGGSKSKDGDSEEEETLEDKYERISALLETIKQLQSVNTALKSAGEPAAAPTEPDGTNVTKIRMLVEKLAALKARNAELKAQQPASAETCAKVAALLQQLQAVKDTNAGLREGKTHAEVTAAVAAYTAAQPTKREQIAALSEKALALRKINRRLKGEEEEEEEEAEVVAPEQATPPPPPTDRNSTGDSPQVSRSLRGKSRMSIGDANSDALQMLPSLEGDAVVIEGMLKRKSTGVVKRWQSRYFQAGNNMIRFYETSKRKKCLGAIDLMNGVNDVQADKKSIHLLMAKGQEDEEGEALMTLQAASSDEAKMWVLALKKMLAEQESNGF